MTMIDWREHIENEPRTGSARAPAVRGSGVEVEAVLSLLRDGWTVERVVARFPGLSSDDVRACIDYAVELLKREKLRVELARRIAAADANPDEGISIEALERRLLSSIPESEE